MMSAVVRIFWAILGQGLKACLREKEPRISGMFSLADERAAGHKWVWENSGAACDAHKMARLRGVNLPPDGWVTPVFGREGFMQNPPLTQRQYRIDEFYMAEPRARLPGWLHPRCIRVGAAGLVCASMRTRHGPRRNSRRPQNGPRLTDGRPWR